MKFHPAASSGLSALLLGPMFLGSWAADAEREVGGGNSFFRIAKVSQIIGASSSDDSKKEVVGNNLRSVSTVRSDVESLKEFYLRLKERADNIAADVSMNDRSLQEKRRFLEELVELIHASYGDFDGIRDLVSQVEGLEWIANLDDTHIEKAVEAMYAVIAHVKLAEEAEDERRVNKLVKTQRKATRKRRTQKENEARPDARQEKDYHSLYRSQAVLTDRFLKKNAVPGAIKSRSRQQLEMERDLAHGRLPLETTGPSRQAQFSKRKLWDLHRRLQASTKEELCQLLVDCVKLMSLYDFFIYIHSDDIDTTQGTVDDNLVEFDERNFEEKFVNIQSTAAELAIFDDAKCNSLLRQFHRTVEVGSVPEWQPGTISQVCLAEGTTAYVQLAEITKVFTVALEEKRDTLTIHTGLFGDWKDWKTTSKVRHFACGADLRFESRKELEASSTGNLGELGDTYKVVSDKAATGLKLRFCDLDDWNAQTEETIHQGDLGSGYTNVWKGWKNCPQNEFIVGAQVRYHDLTALNGLKIYCAPFNTNTGGSTVVVHDGMYGDWKGFGMYGDWIAELKRTDETMFVSGARVKYDDDTAMNGLEFQFETTGEAFWSKQKTIKKKMVPIPFRCAEELFNSDDRMVNHTGETFVFGGCNGTQPFEVCPLEKYRFPVLEDTSSESKLRDQHGQLTSMQGAFSFKTSAGLTSDYKKCELEKKAEYDRENSTVTLNELTENYNKCLQDKYYGPIDQSLELVFGSRPSPGFICGVKDAVKAYTKNDGKALPGYCCLDAPYELDDEHWGYEYDCSINVCKNYGPYFSGISENACLAQGGTFCDNPTDCSDLKTCISEMAVDAISSGKPAFAAFLENSPSITDTTDPMQCGNARRYFGFRANFINDSGICMDIKQLNSSPDFKFLDTFFNQGGENGSGGSEETPLVQVRMPPFVLEKIDRSGSEDTSVQNGVAWRSTNFALEQASEILNDFKEAIGALECPSDSTGMVQTACAVAKNAAYTVFQIIYTVLRTILVISEETRRRKAEWNNIQPIEVWEATNAVYEHMEYTGKYIQDGFDKVLAETYKIQGGTRERLLLEGTKGKDGLTLDFESDAINSLVHYNEVRLNDVEAKLDKNNEVNLDRLNDVEAKLDRLNDVEAKLDRLNDVEAKLDKISKDSHLYLAVEIVKKQTPTTLLVLSTLRGVPQDVEVEVMAYDIASPEGKFPVEFDVRPLGKGETLITMKEEVPGGLVSVKVRGAEIETTRLVSLK